MYQTKKLKQRLWNAGLILVIALVIVGLERYAEQGAEGDKKNRTSPETVQVQDYDLTNGTKARVEHVVDGDTIHIQGGKLVRYIGIDTPETGKGYTYTPECYAEKATERNRELVGGKTVTLVEDIESTDKHGRLLRYVFVDGEFVNETLVEEGYAFAKEYRPNTTRSPELREAQRRAQEDGMGLWTECQGR